VLCRTGIEHEAAAMALVSFDTISLAGAVALLEHVSSHDAKDPEAWLDLVDDETGRVRDWHYFLTANLASALSLGATV
jgi:hypothetical protein